ncbi:MAG: immunity 70 family protein [Tannerellaceae bacterium]|jgi:hypothetical protein|nr:immunity 70 family protein [Tannerellaceae bacterium]
MTVGLRVGPIYYIVGTESFAHSFFSTIAYRLENNKWGSKFPHLMNELYKKETDYKKCIKIRKELEIIKNELSKLTPDKIIWDIEDLTKQPPWGNNLAETITDMSNYYVTSDGKQLFDIWEKALQTAIETKKTLKIQ